MLYVFTEYLSASQVTTDTTWSVVLDDNGSLLSKELNLAEIIDYQAQGQSICLVLSCKNFGLHRIQLPKLSKKDILPALASVLEDQLTEDFSKLYCFYQLNTNHQDTYSHTVGLVDAFLFQQCLNFWSANGVFLNEVTLDWFALSHHQLIMLEQGDAIVSGDMLGWVPRALVSSKLSSEGLTTIAFETSSQRHIWIVEQLKHYGIFDIRMQTRSKASFALSRSHIEKWFKWGLLSWYAASFLVFIGFFAHNWWQYSKNQSWIESFSEQPTESLELKLAKYRHHQSEKNKFWGVFIALQRAVSRSITIKSFDYNQEHLRIAVVATDMSHFQEFKRSLIRSRLKVDVSQVLVQQEGIKANIDLRVAK